MYEVGTNLAYYTIDLQMVVQVLRQWFREGHIPLGKQNHSSAKEKKYVMLLCNYLLFTPTINISDIVPSFRRSTFAVPTIAQWGGYNATNSCIEANAACQLLYERELRACLYRLQLLNEKVNKLLMQSSVVTVVNCRQLDMVKRFTVLVT